MSSIRFKFPSWALFVCSLVALPIVAACGNAHTVKTRFAAGYVCMARNVNVTDLGGERYRAVGCDHDVIYDCDNSGCSREPTNFTELDQKLAGSPTKAAKRESLAQVAHRQTTGGQSTAALDVTLDDRTLLKLRATDKPAVQLKLVHIESDPNLESCSLEWMLNGERITAPKTHFSRDGALSTLKNTIPEDLLHDLGSAQQFALRACRRRWSIRPEQLEEVRRFVVMYEEDVAWQGSPKATSNGMLAPAGGWLDWKVSEHAPEAVTSGDPLAGPELFKLLSPAVFKVEALRASGEAIGSAVAISKTQLLTNCHVVQGAQKVLLKQDQKEYVARLVRSDPKHDRCVLEVPDPVLAPARGVRTYASLQIGEALFTIGTPDGLERTLSNGLLSGLRQEDGRDFVQTTAPISPGSSGGGLFDARGNLVGITTLVLLGREHINQSLNFAVPADSFWQP